jgi:FkbM family methyltransferase
MGNPIKSLLRLNPRVFDISKSCQMIFANKDASWRFFDAFSKEHNRRVNFLYIGANDGYRSDPIRYFIVRDHWQGVLVEPLPDVFQSLKDNFRYYKKSKLVVVNAAISSNNTSLSFWTFDDKFLASLDREERVDYLRKSSFDRDHVLRFLDLTRQSTDVVKEIKVPCQTVAALVRNSWDGEPINLFVMDAEGHEASIIPSIDFSVVRPEAIYFESHNLGQNKTRIYSFLAENGYGVAELGGDSVALLRLSPSPVKSDLGSLSVCR